jgi:hypothetical protein
MVDPVLQRGIYTEEAACTIAVVLPPSNSMSRSPKKGKSLTPSKVRGRERKFGESGM